MVFDLFGPEKTKRRRLTAGEKTKILKRQQYECNICDRDISKTVIHFDHKKALSRWKRYTEKYSGIMRDMS